MRSERTKNSRSKGKINSSVGLHGPRVTKRAYHRHLPRCIFQTRGGMVRGAINTVAFLGLIRQNLERRGEATRNQTTDLRLEINFVSPRLYYCKPRYYCKPSNDYRPLKGSAEFRRVSSEFEYLPVGGQLSSSRRERERESGCRPLIFCACVHARVCAPAARRKRVRDGETGNYEG